MRVERTTPVSFRAYQINANQNKQVKFLYNKASDILKQEQQTVIFATDYIKFDKMTEKLKLAFEKAKIIWNEVK